MMEDKELDRYFETSLVQACKSDDVDKFDLLIEEGLDLEKFGSYITSTGCLYSSIKIFERAVNLGVEVHHRSIIDTVELGNLNMTKRLIELGADVNCVSVLGQRPIFIAAETGSIEMFQFLINNGADCWVRDFHGNSLAHYACRYHMDEKFLRYFAESGVDFNCKNIFNETPLLVAVKYRNLVAVNFFLSQKVNVNICDVYGNSPLHAAVEDNNLAVINVCIVENLIKNDANVNAKNDQGNTPLHLIGCHRRNYFETVELLLYYGADIHSLNNKGVAVFIPYGMRYMIAKYERADLLNRK